MEEFRKELNKICTESMRAKIEEIKKAHVLTWEEARFLINSFSNFEKQYANSDIVTKLFILHQFKASVLSSKIIKDESRIKEINENIINKDLDNLALSMRQGNYNHKSLMIEYLKKEIITSDVWSFIANSNLKKINKINKSNQIKRGLNFWADSLKIPA